MAIPITEGAFIIGRISEIVIARVTRKIEDGADPLWEICEPGAGTYAMRESLFSDHLLVKSAVFPFAQGSVVRVNLAVEMTAAPGPDEARSEAMFVVTTCSTVPNSPVPGSDQPENGVAHCIPISVGRGSRGEQYAWDIDALTLVTAPPA